VSLWSHMTFSAAQYAAATDSAAASLDEYMGWSAALATPINTPNSAAGAHSHCTFLVKRVASGGTCTDGTATNMDFAESYASFQ
jgi:hypothetical protein